MSLRRPGPGVQERAPKGGAGQPRRRVPPLPRLRSPELAAARGADGGSAWWRDRDPAPPRPRSPAPRLPVLLAGSPRAARSGGELRALLLPPLLGSSASPPARRPRRDAPDAWGGLLEELLPGKFRDFLQQLRAKCAEPETQAPPAPQHLTSESKRSLGSQCPNYPFLPDLWDHSSHLQDSGETLFHQKPSLWSPRSDHSQFTTVKKTSPLHSTQPPKVKAVLIQTPSGEGSRPRRRCCPFRVRFEDETLQDTALRYWERSRAVRQNIFRTEQSTLPAVSVSERVLGSVGRWLESLPKALNPGVKKAVGSSSCWDYPYLSSWEPQVYLSEDGSTRSSLPFIPRTTTRRHPGGLKTFLDSPTRMEQPVDKSPNSWSQKMVSNLLRWATQSSPA